MTRSFFFVFDGVDGSGKTTQIRRLSTWLEARGRRVVTCRDPGTSELGESIRSMLLRSTDVPICNRAEMLLYMAARAQLVSQVIQPALERGETVISDRYLLANVVYQGHAGGLDPPLLWQVGEVATAGTRPDLTMILDLDPDVAALRRQGPPDRLERRGQTYFRRVREGFLAEAANSEHPLVVIDASQTPDAVEADVRRAVLSVMRDSAEAG